jgi:hypothetical protein
MNLYWRLKRRSTLRDERKKIIILGYKNPAEGEARLVQEFISRLISGIEEFRWIRSWEDFYPLFHDGFLNIVKSYNYSYPRGEGREFYAAKNQELFEQLREAGAPDLIDDLVLVPPPEFWSVVCYDLSDMLFPEWAQEKVAEGVSVDYLRNYSLAKHVIALSRSVKRELIKLGVDHRKITVLPYDFGDAVKRGFAVGPRNYLLIPIYGEERDNLENVRRAVDAVRPNMKLKTVILYLTPQKRSVKEEDGFIYVRPGSQSEIEKWFSRAKAVLYAPLYDGWGWPAFTAIRYGRPLISGNNHALLEIGPGYAEYVREDEPEHIVHVLRRVLNKNYRVSLEVREDIIRSYASRNSRGILKKIIENTLVPTENE